MQSAAPQSADQHARFALFLDSQLAELLSQCKYGKIPSTARAVTQTMGTISSFAKKPSFRLGDAVGGVISRVLATVKTSYDPPFGKSSHH